MCALSLDCRLVYVYAFTIEYTVMRSIMNMFNKRMPYLIFIRNESILATKHLFISLNVHSLQIFYSKWGCDSILNVSILVWYAIKYMETRNKIPNESKNTFCLSFATRTRHASSFHLTFMQNTITKKKHIYTKNVKKEYVQKLHSFQMTAFNEMKEKKNVYASFAQKYIGLTIKWHKIVGKHETMRDQVNKYRITLSPFPSHSVSMCVYECRVPY